MCDHDADGMLGLNMKWVPDSASHTHFASLIQLASATRCVVIGTSFFPRLQKEDYELLDLPVSLWNMLVDDRFTYVTWNWGTLRRKFNESFELCADGISIVDVQASPLLARDWRTLIMYARHEESASLSGVCICKLSYLNCAFQWHTSASQLAS